MLCLGFPSSEVGRRGPTHRAAVRNKREGTSTRSQLLLGPRNPQAGLGGHSLDARPRAPSFSTICFAPAILRHAEVVVQSRGPQG